MPVTPWETFKALGDFYADERMPRPAAERQEKSAAPDAITDHTFIPYYPDSEYDMPCGYIYTPDNPLYADPSGGWMMGGPIECGGSREQHEEHPGA